MLGGTLLNGNALGSTQRGDASRMVPQHSTKHVKHEAHAGVQSTPRSFKFHLDPPVLFFSKRMYNSLIILVSLVEDSFGGGGGLKLYIFPDSLAIYFAVVIEKYLTLSGIFEVHGN